MRLSWSSRVLMLAAILGTVGLCCYVASTQSAHMPASWMRTGGNSLHLGQEMQLPTLQPAAMRSGRYSAPLAAGPFTIAALSLEASNTCPLLPRLVTALAEQQRLPLLSWTIAVGSGRRRAYWHSLAIQLKRVPGPVLLRPLLDAPTAAAYRRDWHYMVDELKRAGVENAVWVWTPTAADSTFQRFPGPAYASWLANPLVARDNAPSYPALRARTEQARILHQLPVLLLAPCPSGSPLRAAQRLVQAYPRVKAIVFDAAARQSLLTASLTLPKNHRHQ
jgi:cellulose synthase (UDP-forming)